MLVMVVSECGCSLDVPKYRNVDFGRQIEENCGMEIKPRPRAALGSGAGLGMEGARLSSLNSSSCFYLGSKKEQGLLSDIVRATSSSTMKRFSIRRSGIVLELFSISFFEDPYCARSYCHTQRTSETDSTKPSRSQLIRHIHR